jgi:predicted alpha-1,2-mannosidase
MTSLVDDDRARGADGLAERNRVLRTTLALTMAAALAVPVLGPLAPPAPAAVPDPASLVNTFIGTQNEGNTFPGASTPFGMVQVSPDTLRADDDTDDWSHTGYNWDHPRIRGFSQLHPSGVGCSLGGNLPIMPTTGELTSTRPGANASTYSHDDESAEPGYYSVVLDDYDITAELTATTRTGTQRYTYPETEQANVFLYAGRALREVTSSTVTVLDDQTIEIAMTGQGFCQDTEPYTVYTVTEFDRPFESATVFSGDEFVAGTTSTSGSGNRGVVVTFDATDDQDVEVTTGLSWVDSGGARANLEAERGASFDETRAAAYDTWNAWLGRIEVAGGTETQQRTFYSSLYRALLSPNTGSDVDGRYTGWDQEIHTAEEFTYYQTWSLWDTYRTQQQLLSLVAPEQMTDMARSILAISEQTGWLPRWGYGTVETNIMTGDPVAPFLVSAYDQGLLAGFEEDVYAALVHNADTVPPPDHPANGRAGLPHYLEHGYVPHEPGAPKKPGDFDLHHGASATLEYAVADGAIASMAAGLGHTADAARFAERAQSYRTIFDPRTGFFRARNAQGAFIGEADPAHGVGFHEGSAWHYLWHVQHDVPGLVDLIGGAEETVERLDSFFAYDALLADRENTVRNVWVNGPYDYYGQDTYNPQNEPNIHSPYIYQWVGQPWKTVDVVHGALTLYTDGPAGVTGNDDMGTMSSWHVLASIGLYPSVPGADTWALTTPVFTEVTISGESTLGADVRISAPGSSEDNRYISAVTVNGADHDRSYVDGEVLRGGADIVYTLSTEPGDWATGADAAPPALSHVDVDRHDLAAGLSPTRVLATASDEAVEIPLTLDVVATGPGTVTGTAEVSTTEPLSLAEPIEWSIESHNLPTTESFAIPLVLAAGAEAEEYLVTVTVRAGDREVERQATVLVGRESMLAPHLNNTGIGDEGADNADLDNLGWYLLRGALADAGIVQGRTYQVPGTDLSYQLATVPAGEPDNVVADGQQVDLTGALTGATRFAFVGTATSGTQAGEVRVRLDDGGSFTSTIAFTDWCSNDLVGGNVEIARTSHRGANAGTDGVRCALFATSPVPVPEGREVVGIDLPVNPNLHIFAIASDAPELEEPGDTVVDEVAAVTFDDEARTYTVPSTVGVEYVLGSGDVLAGGTYDGAGTVVVTARAVEGYEIAAGVITRWEHTFAEEPSEEPTEGPTEEPTDDPTEDQTGPTAPADPTETASVPAGDGLPTAGSDGSELPRTGTGALWAGALALLLAVAGGVLLPARRIREP